MTGPRHDRPIRVWKYHGWCAVCNQCRHALVVDAGSHSNALGVALTHLHHRHSQIAPLFQSFAGQPA